MTRFWTIAGNTFTQTLRQNVFLVLLGLILLMLILSVPLSGWTIGAEGGDYQQTDQRMLEENGLTTVLVGLLLITAFSASNAIGREIENATALTVLSKPVDRATFVLAKFAGVAAAVTVAFYLASLGYLMTVRHGVMSSVREQADMPVIVLGALSIACAFVVAVAGNYLFGWTFTSTMVYSLLITMSVAMLTLSSVAKQWTLVPFGADVNQHGKILWPFRWQIFASLALIYLAILILVSVAVAASSRLGQIATILTTLGVLFVGSVHAALFGRYGQLAPIRALGWSLPKLPIFYKLHAMTNDIPIPAGYVALASLYALLYIAGVLCIAMALFQTRQLDARNTSSTMPGPVTLLTRLGQGACLLAALVVVPALAWRAQRLDTFTLLLLGGGILGAALAFWIWTLFGRGVRWAWWAVLALHVLTLNAFLAAGFARLYSQEPQTGGQVELLALSALLNIVVLVMIFMPETRHHFTSGQKAEELA
jgi:ABC-type transport system involved in multi-copper enzyme maturation permease subunit